MSKMNHLNLIDKCNDCCCPTSNNVVVADEVAREKARSQALEDNEFERKRLICDLEMAGVTFPIAEYEMMAHRKLLAGYTNTDGDAFSDDDYHKDGDAALSLDNLTGEDYATSMPEDLKDLLRRYYQLEAEREQLQQMVGMNTAPNSVNGDAESQSVSLRRVTTPRAPFWYFRRGSVAVVENEQRGVYETQERSGKSRHVWVDDYGVDDSSLDSSRVTVVYPKERARKIWMGLFCCCLVMLGLIALAVYYAMGNNQSKEETPNIMADKEALTTASPTSAPTEQMTPSPTTELCVDEISITGTCFVRSETFGVRFKNCNPSPDDWLGLYPGEVDPSSLSEDYLNWMYTCGNKQCRGVVQASFYSFQTFEPGNYTIHLIRNKDDPPYSAYASTKEFFVVENQLDCPSDVYPDDIPGASP